MGDNVKKGIVQVLEGAKEKKRKFVETIELQIALKDYDTQRDKRFSGTVKLPHVPRHRLKICVLGDAVHCEQAQNAGLPFMSVDDLKKLTRTRSSSRTSRRSTTASSRRRCSSRRSRVCWARVSTRPASSRLSSRTATTSRTRSVT